MNSNRSTGILMYPEASYFPIQLTNTKKPTRKTRIRKNRSSSFGDETENDVFLNTSSKDPEDQLTKSLSLSALSTSHYIDKGLTVDDIIRCMCIYVLSYAEQSYRDGYMPSPEYMLFNLDGVDVERFDTSPRRREDAIPTLEVVIDFVAFIHSECQLEYDCMIISLIYLERMVDVSKRKFRVCYDNWRAAFFTCILLASKVWDDFAMKNADFASLFENLSLERTNRMEYLLLTMFDFRIGVSVVEYTKCNYKLIDMAKQGKELRYNTQAFQQKLETIISRAPSEMTFDNEKIPGLKKKPSGGSKGDGSGAGSGKLLHQLGAAVQKLLPSVGSAKISAS